MKNDILHYFSQMVKIDSESGEEKEFLAFLEKLFREEINSVTKYDAHGNLIIQIGAKNTRNENPILFCCHADTVKPGKGIEPELVEGTIYSKSDTILGADDKAGIAEIFMAMLKASQHPPVEIIITREEEIGLSGSSYLDCSMLKAKEGYVLDSEALEEIIIGGPSRVELKVKITGRSAHAVEPENGISAIEVAAHGISLLKTGWIDPITTVNIGLIEGGQVINAIPENALVQIECRSQENKKCLEQSKLIKRTFQAVARARGAKVEIETSQGLKACHIPENSRVVEVAKRSIKSVGLKPKAKIICGGTDASNLNQKGIRTAVLGVGGKLPHSKNESIALKDMEKAVDILVEILKEYSK